MEIKLAIVQGPHAGKEFLFEGHDTFLVGRSKDAHFQLNKDDPYFSRRHFLIEINPPRCRMLDLKSRNGTYVNGVRVDEADLQNGDEIKAGHTVIRVVVLGEADDKFITKALPEPYEQNEQPAKPLLVHTLVQEKQVKFLPREGVCPVLEGLQIIEEIGQGGMGIVYRGIRQSDQKPVAVKTIQPAVGVSRKVLDKFLREARILSEIEHKHVVRYFDSGEVSGLLFFVMELVEGTNASDLLRRYKQLDIRTASRMMCQLLSALDYAHRLGFVHRDIKPSNMLIAVNDGAKVTKLADFGLARAYQTSQISGLTMQGEFAGTIPFMAPEQATHFRDVKPSADQFSAAATFYNLLTGKFIHDFPASTGKQLVHLLTEKPISIQDRRPDIPKALVQVIHRALSREPSDRFPDVKSFRMALLPFAK